MKSKLNWLEAALLLAPFFVLIFYWNLLPARVPMHWNFRGEIDSWGSKAPGLLLAPLMGVAVVVLLRALPKFDPKLRRTLDESGRMHPVLSIIRIALLGLFDVILYVQIAAAVGWKIDAGRILMACILIFLAIMGNYLGTLRPNYLLASALRGHWKTLRPGERLIVSADV